jgi:hypothetical protein
MSTPRVIFRIGPALLIPPLAFWAMACHALTTEEGGAWWQVYPAKAALAVAALWHVGLITFERPRLGYLIYAAAHGPIFWLLYVWALIWATRFPV